ncbi:MAG: hypothetical protein B5M52_00730 [Helicobacteraceae bacterium 4484_230]|nr:MAG: hypothetical protein B5M52_00730 [Helicobacteraceae bacterium 4484_230]
MLYKIRSSVLFKNTFVYMMTVLINKAVPFLLLPVLTVYLSPEDYGTAATYMAYIGLLGVAVHLNMTGAVNVNFFRFSTKEELRVYVFNVLLIVSVAASLLFVLLLFAGDWFGSIIGLPVVWLYVGLAAVVAQFFTMLNLGLWQVQQKAKQYGIYQIALTLATVSMVLLLVVVYGLKWQGQLAGQAVAAIVFAFISLAVIVRRGFLTLQIEPEYIKDALKFGIPLIPHALSGWFRTGVDRFFLTAILGSAATGIYAVGYQFGMIIGIAAMAFNQAFSPYLYRKLKTINEAQKLQLVKLTYLSFAAFLLLAAIITFGAPWVIARFLDARYASAAEVVPWVAFGYAFQGMYFMVVNYIFYLKKTYILAAVTFFSGLLHVVISYMLIHSNGEIGASQATTISFFIMFVMVWILSARLYKMPWGLK